MVASYVVFGNRWEVLAYRCFGGRHGARRVTEEGEMYE